MAALQQDPQVCALVQVLVLKHPAAKGCTDDDTLAIVPIYIPILD
jgi:hypothetical protein